MTTITKAIPLCKDCRYFLVGYEELEMGKCGHSSASIPAKINLVSGRIIRQEQLFATVCRESALRCGAVGLYWEANDEHYESSPTIQSAR